MKFIHAADLHLDRPFEGAPYLNETGEEIVKQANEVMFQRLIELCCREEVDLLLLAGDTFHQSVPSLYTQSLFVKGMERLHQAGIAVFLSFGNHDYFNPEKYWFPFPENVQLFTTEEVTTKTLTLKNGEKVAVTGFSYQSRWLEKNLAQSFPQRWSGVDYQLGMYHGEVGTAGNARYAPFSLADLKAHDYDYWALGHIHKAEILAQTPPIVYAGTPQGHNRKEQAIAGVVLVELNQQQLKMRFEKVNSVAWRSVTCDLGQVKASEQLFPRIWQTLTQSLKPAVFQFVTLTFTQTENLPDTVLQLLKSADFLAQLQLILPDALKAQLTVVHLEISALSVQKLPFGISRQLLQFVAEDFQTEAVRSRYQAYLNKQSGLIPYTQFTEKQWQELLKSAEEMIVAELQVGDKT